MPSTVGTAMYLPPAPFYPETRADASPEEESDTEPPSNGAEHQYLTRPELAVEIGRAAEHQASGIRVEFRQQ